MNIEICDDATRTRFLLDVQDVVLARHLPRGDGTLTFLSPPSSRVICISLTFEDVMAAVFAGATPIDVEI